MKGYVYLFLMFLTSAISTILIKLLLNSNVNPFQLQFYTSLISIIILTLIKCRQKIKFNFKNKFSVFIAALTGFVIFEIAFNLSMQYMSVTQTMVLYYLNPIFLYFAGIFFIKDGRKRIKMNVIYGMIISFIGVYFASTKGDFTSFNIDIEFRGLLYMGIAIFSIVFFIIYNKKNQINERQYLILGQVISVIICGIIMITTNKIFIPNIQELFLLILIAILYNILNTLFYIKTIKELAIEKLSTLTYLSPVITSVLAIVILKEEVYIATILGLGLVIFGNIIAYEK